VYGWPNENSRPGFVKHLGWSEWGRGLRRAGPLSLAQRAGRACDRRGWPSAGGFVRRFAGIGAPLHARSAAYLGPELPYWYDDLWACVRSSVGFGLDRDADFLRYKALFHGYFFAWNKEAAQEDRAVLALLLSEQGPAYVTHGAIAPSGAGAAARLLRDVRPLVAQLGAAVWWSWDSPAPVWRDFLERAGFATTVQPEIPVFGRTLVDSFDVPPLESWDLMPCYSDVW
jgi:hypothetical protein